MYDEEKDNKNAMTMLVLVTFGTKYRKAVVITATHRETSNAIARELNCMEKS